MKSFDSMGRSNDDQNSSLMTNTINPNIAKLSFRVNMKLNMVNLYIL